MPAHDSLLAVAREWLLKAGNDLRTAEHTLTLGDDCPTDTVCFHAQQCAEKCLKALLVVAGTDVPRTHDLERLNTLLHKGVPGDVSPEQLARLADYAIATRYPGWDPISVNDAQDAAALARHIWDNVHARIPAAE